MIGVFAPFRQIREARRLREAQVRPFVVVDFEAESTLIHLTIENVGVLPAKGVMLTFDPPMRSVRDDPWPPAGSTLMTEGIPTLPPGKKYRFFLDSFRQRLEAKLPLTYVADLTYTTTGRKEPFHDEYTLDLSFLMEVGEARRKTLHDLTGQVEKIATAVSRWTEHLNGIRVYVIDKETYDRETSISMAMNDVRRRVEQGEIDDVGSALKEALMAIGETADPPAKWIEGIESGSQLRWQASDLDGP